MDNIILTQIPVGDLLAMVKIAVRDEINAASRLNEAPPSKDRPITQKELCEFLNVTEPTILRWRKKGKIPFFQIGTAIRFNLSDVLKSLGKS